jgi:hypothetical protein
MLPTITGTVLQNKNLTVGQLEPSVAHNTDFPPLLQLHIEKIQFSAALHCTICSWSVIIYMIYDIYIFILGPYIRGQKCPRSMLGDRRVRRLGISGILGAFRRLEDKVTRLFRKSRDLITHRCNATSQMNEIPPMQRHIPDERNL